MKAVFITRKIPDAGISLLRGKGYRVDVRDQDAMIGMDELKGAARRYDALITMPTDPVNREVMAAAVNLSIISNHAVGYNNIDIAGALERNIMVTHTPGVLTDATAEIAFALMIGLMRNIIAADRYTRSDRFTGWDPMLFHGDELSGKTVGIIGMGRIGQAMAGRCRAFGMHILYHNRHPVDPETEKRLSAAHTSFDDLLKTADVISLHTPLTIDTRHLINSRAFGVMKPGIYLINTSRGEVIDEAALVDALNAGVVKGAGLDVYEFEPEVTHALKTMDNVILLPHIGSATVETRSRMSAMAAQNVVDALEGRRPKHLIPEMQTHF